jgi:hypothetical protein
MIFDNVSSKKKIFYAALHNSSYNASASLWFTPYLPEIRTKFPANPIVWTTELEFQ